MSHGDSVVRASRRASPSSRRRRAATSPRWATRRASIYGVQFHPEVVHTEHGRTILANFLRGIAGLARRLGDGARSSNAAIAEIRAQVGNDEVICALSGGVDSAVAATLVARARSASSSRASSSITACCAKAKRRASRSQRFATCCISTCVAVDARERFLEASWPASKIPSASGSSSGTSSSRSSKKKRAKIPGVQAISCRERSIPT